MSRPEPSSFQGTCRKPDSSTDRRTWSKPFSTAICVRYGIPSWPPATQARSSSRSASVETSAGSRNAMEPMIRLFKNGVGSGGTIRRPTLFDLATGRNGELAPTAVPQAVRRRVVTPESTA